MPRRHRRPGRRVVSGRSMRPRRASFSANLAPVSTPPLYFLDALDAWRPKGGRMRRAWWVVIVVLVWAGQVGGRAETPDRLLGFDMAGSATQRDLESKFDAAIQSSHVKGWLEHLAARPHHVGSPYDKANAEFMADLFKSWG